MDSIDIHKEIKREELLSLVDCYRDNIKRYQDCIKVELHKIDQVQEEIENLNVKPVNKLWIK